jgi:FixJ family two-component response regulator
MMPGMTGMQFHAWLVAHDPSLAARVVFITGGAFTPNATDYLERVAAPRLDKPFDAEKMRATVANMVASR